MMGLTSSPGEWMVRCWSGPWSPASPGDTCQAGRRAVWVRWSHATPGLSTLSRSLVSTWVMVQLTWLEW